MGFESNHKNEERGVEVGRNNSGFLCIFNLKGLTLLGRSQKDKE